MRIALLIFFIGYQFNISAQKEIQRSHTTYSCNKCYCHEWHKKNVNDSLDGKILVESKVRRGSGSRCFTDSYTKIIILTTKYYSDEKIRSIEKQKGWFGTYGHKFKITTQYFDDTGKRTKKTKTTDKVDLR